MSTDVYPNGFRDRTSWYAGLSAYWFATSFKWFILLLVVLPGQVKDIVPGGEKGTYWGMVFAIGATWAIIGPSLFGYISDRTGFGRNGNRRAPWITIGASLTVVALVLLAGANQLWTIVAGYLLLQVADDVGTGPYSALIPELVPEEFRGKASGWLGLATNAGQIAIGILALVLGDVTRIYIAIAVVNILGAWWVVHTIRNVQPLAPPENPQRPTLKGFIQGWIEPWRSRDFFWVWFTRFLNAFGFYLVVNYLRFYLADSVSSFRLFGIGLGDDGMATNVLALTISLLGIFGALYAAKVSDGWGRKRVIYVAGTLMSAVIVPAALVHDFTFIWIMAVLFGIGYGMYLSADWALVSDVLPNKDEAGKDMGVWQMSNSVVQIFTGAAGALVDWGNRQGRGNGYTIAFLVSAVAFFLSTVLVRQVRGSR